MQDVQVDKQQLLDVIKRNREQHHEVYLKAWEKYKERVIEELNQRLEDARHGRKIITHIALPEPEDHTSDYDRVIRMLEMDQRSSIELPEHEFAIYVMDQWDWKRAWLMNTLSYANAK